VQPATTMLNSSTSAKNVSSHRDGVRLSIYSGDAGERLDAGSFSGNTRSFDRGREPIDEAMAKMYAELSIDLPKAGRVGRRCLDHCI